MEDLSKPRDRITHELEYIIKQWKNEKGIRYELLKLFPLEIADKNMNQDAYNILAQYGSPAMTDGKKVFFSPDITAKLFTENKFYRYQGDFEYDRYDRSVEEENWKLQADTTRPVDIMHRGLENEIQSILLHEYTHAYMGHSSLAEQFKDKGEDFQNRLSVAFEIQANDGVFGDMPWCKFAQQLKGVTNKRLHPETLGAHTLKEIMEKLKLTPNEKNGGGNSRRQQEGRKKLAQATGAMEADNPGGNEVSLEKSTQEDAITQEIFGGNLKNIKGIVAEALSTDLKYDPYTDKVIKAPAKKKIKEASYSRPSKKYAEGGIIKKGIKKYKIKDPVEVKKLLLIAVDTSGSMEEVARYVGGITDKLLKDVKDVAAQYNIDVNYDRVLGTTFSDYCEVPVQINSDEWRYKMHNLHVGGGTNFMSVVKELHRIQKLKQYDEITVLCVGDGQGMINNNECPLSFGTETLPLDNVDRFKWVDARIATAAVQDGGCYGNCLDCDYYKGVRSGLIITDVVE